MLYKKEETHELSYIPMVYGVCLMLLALFKAITVWKESRRFMHSRLVKVLLRDQIMLFSLCVHTFLLAKKS